MATRKDFHQVVVLIPTYFEVYGLNESYQAQMRGHAPVLGRQSKVTVSNPQTLVSKTSRGDRANTNDTKINCRRYIQLFAAAAKLGHDIGQIEYT